MALPVYQSFNEGKTAGATTVVVTKPTGVADGDLLIGFLATDGVETHTSPESGSWNDIYVNQSEGSSKQTFSMWWKIAGGSEPADYTFTTGSSEAMYAWVIRVTGTDTSSPIHKKAVSTGDSTSATHPEVTTEINDCLIIRAFGIDHADVTTDGGWASVTNITVDSSDTGNSACAGGAGWEDLATLGGSGTEINTLTSIEEWVAITIAIREPGSGTSWALISTSALTVSTVGLLSRGTVEALISTSNLTTSTTGLLSRGIAQVLASTSNLVTSTLGLLSKGYARALTSTSALAITTTGVLSRGVVEALISTANLAVTTTSILSRGIAKVLVSTSDLVTTTIGVLSRGKTQTLVSTANIATSTLGLLNKGYARALTSTANMVTYITGALSDTGWFAGFTGWFNIGWFGTIGVMLNSLANIVVSTTGTLSRGIVETLTSTSNLTTSTTGILSRGIIVTLNSTISLVTLTTGRIVKVITLISTSNIVTSTVGVLSRGVTRALISTSNMVTSTVGLLSRGIVEALTSTANLVTLTIANLLRGWTEEAKTSLSWTEEEKNTPMWSEETKEEQTWTEE